MLEEILKEFDCCNCARNVINGGECDPDISRCNGFKKVNKE